MAKPFDLDIKIPLQSDGWVQVHLRADDIETMSAGDRKFMIQLIGKVQAFAHDMLCAGLVNEEDIPEALRGKIRSAI